MKSTISNPLVFFDIDVGNRSMGRITFELFSDIVPKTAENFRCLCTGERGSIVSGKSRGKPLSYKGSCFHRIIPGFMAQGGDFTSGDGRGGESIYGEAFPDENFDLQHTESGLLSMANSGPNTNGSQFFITFKSTPHLNNRHVVFGRIVEGKKLLAILEGVVTDSTDKPKAPVCIVDCGQLSNDSTELASANTVADTCKATVADGDENVISFTSFTGRESKKKSYSHGRMTSVPSAEEVPAKGPIVNELECEPSSDIENDKEEPVVHSTEGMTAIQKRLFNIRSKMNQGRKANKREVQAEYKRFTDPRGYDYAEHIQKERKECSKTIKETQDVLGLNSCGSSDTASLLTQPATASQKLRQKEEKKLQHERTFGHSALTRASEYHQYEKSLGNMPSHHTVTQEHAISVTNSNGASASGLERLTRDIQNREEKRLRNSGRRHREEFESNSSGAINDKNAMFNKKIKRSFDKYTVEIRQNLERGTAI